MMVKTAMKRPLMESSPSSSSYLVAEEARASLRYQNLLQDYEDLVKETRAKAKKLRQVNQKKLKLLREVKFLRRKFKSFTKNPSFEISNTAKKQSSKMGPPPARNALLPSKVHLEDQNHKVAEAAVPGTAALFDLNQDVDEFEARELPRIERLKRWSADGSTIIPKFTPCQ